MPKPFSNDQVTLATRQQLIKAFPCFTALAPTQSAELATLLHEIEFLPQEQVTHENDLVDSVYIIVQGEAEASREMHPKKLVHVPIAALRTGESIGLSDTGFYSPTGQRTATVTAITKLLLLKLDLKDLYAFLQKHNLEHTMRATSLQMLRMRFIKQSLPFVRLSHERLQWLAARVEEVKFAPGAVIFKQGDIGDKCYLIRHGKVEIINHKDGTDHQIAILTPPVLFGEAVLITHTTRNATARALDECELLVLQHEHLTELIESEKNVAQTFMALMIDRSLPLRNPRVSLHQRTAPDGQEITILKNPDNGNYFRLSNEGAFVWHQLDGKHTLQDITLDLATTHNVFAPDIVAALIAKLSQTKFVENVQIETTFSQHSLPWWRRGWAVLKQVADVRFASGDTDAWVTHIYQQYVRYLLTPYMLVIWSCLAMMGFMIFMGETATILHYFNHKHASLWLLLGLLPLSIVAVVLHELGHAFAVKRFNREVHYMGVGWRWLVPIAFTDTSDMWLSARKPRMIVNIAGVCVDVVIAGICSFLILVVTHPFLQALLWLFALYIYISSFRKLSPLQDMDGYYVLMDWLERDHLRKDAVLWLRRPRLPNHLAEILYWLACVGYLACITLLTLVLQSFVFIIFGISVHTFLSLILPFLVLLASTLNIFLEIRYRT